MAVALIVLGCGGKLTSRPVSVSQWEGMDIGLNLRSYKQGNREVILDTMNTDKVTQTEHVKREQNNRPSVGLRKPRQGQRTLSLVGWVESTE